MRLTINDVLEQALRRTSFDKHHHYLREFFQSQDFQDQFARMIDAKRYDAMSLAEIFHPIFAGIYNKDIKNWLLEILTYTMHLNFTGFEDQVDVDRVPYHHIFLDCLRYVNELEISAADQTLFLHPIALLTEEEEHFPDVHPEYFTFKREFLENFVYEMMKIDIGVRGYNTIQHVIAVNALSMHIARQLHTADHNIDLGLVAGAGLCHDVGKYGIKEGEAKRIAYYHYYYTYDWYERRGLEKMGNIATNHSTWDLEIYNLSIEAMLLIYADFRVKNIDVDGQQVMSIISLEDSYQVILDKLDNVDEAKKNRYSRVYKRLVDFEKYLCTLGVTINPDEEPNKEYPDSPFSHFALLQGQEVIKNLIDFSIDHNLTVMQRFSRDQSFNTLMETVRGENDNLTLRQYLELLHEYSSYFTLKQKRMVMQFLFDLLLNDADDIRRDAGTLIGYLLANFDDDYKKEIPPSISIDTLHGAKAYQQLLHTMLFPSVNLLDHKDRLQYNLLAIHEELFAVTKDNVESYITYYVDLFGDNYQFTDTTLSLLARTLVYAPLDKMTDKQIAVLQKFLARLLRDGSQTTRLIVFDLLREMDASFFDNEEFVESMIGIVKTADADIHPSKAYLLNTIAHQFGEDIDLPERITDYYASFEQGLTQTFLDNLKTETPWIQKKLNIEILFRAAVERRDKLFHISMHYCNLLKVSEFDVVRKAAGEALIGLVSRMAKEEVNDIAVELLRGLELNDYNFVRLIPRYLGEIFLYLPTREFYEILDDLDMKLKSSDLETLHGILHTLGRAIEMFDEYVEKGMIESENYHKKQNRMMGLLLSVMASPKLLVHTEAFSVIGNYVFNSNHINPKTQAYYLKEYGKKILTLLTTNEEGFTYLSNSYSLNQIYKCITEYQLTFGEIEIPNREKIAFFPGTFDPFSNGHLAICNDVRDMGYEVYIAIDEFSWSKKPLPYKTRKNIVNMSISQEADVYVFPSDIPVNISNEENMQTLMDLFPGREVTMLVGADVVTGASAYGKNALLAKMPHLVYIRQQQVEEKMDALLKEKLEGPYELMALESDIQFISSTLIRDSIDNQRDIHHLVNPMVRDYIMEHKLYKRDDPFKSTIGQSQYTMEFDNQATEDDRAWILNITKEDIGDHILRKRPSVLRFRDAESKEIICIAIYEKIQLIDLYRFFDEAELIAAIREKTRGPIAYLHGIFISRRYNHLREDFLNEAFAHVVSNHYDNLMYTNKMRYNKEYTDLLLQAGFAPVLSAKNYDTLLVDCSNPVTVNLDIEKYIKKPYQTHPSILQSIKENRRHLKEALTKLFPNALILTFTRAMINQKLIERICKFNNVPPQVQEPRVLGENMCVPFGEHLNGEIVPNTVTKTIHTEKVFNKDISNFTIDTFPGYLALDEQCKTIHAFDRPVLLVDDLLHKGYRIRVVKPTLERNDVAIEKLFVGILSMQGLEFAMQENMGVDYCYFIPRLRYWFKESDLYPYIGGNQVQTNLQNGMLLPSINLLLPYVSPAFIKEGSNEDIYELSRVCLENAHSLFKQLEKVYLEHNGKTVAIRDAFDILRNPRIPDYKGLEDMDLSISSSLENDMSLLKRLRTSVIRDSGARHE